MRSRLTDTDYQLRWPRGLFAQEASDLLNRRQLRDWDDRCELLLVDAFVGGADSGPFADFRTIVDGDGIHDFERTHDNPFEHPPSNTLNERHRFLQNLLRRADQLHEASQHRRPYWSQRQRGVPAHTARQAETARQFVALVSELDALGYFERAFGKDCVDDPAEVDASDVIEYEIGVPDLWPLPAHLLSDNLDLFCDVVEVLHDLVARPGKRHFHSFSGCGWHHGQFSIETGRTIYRWRVNQLLARSDLGLRLAEDGEDIGRMVTVPGDARGELVETMANRDDGETGDQVRHAIALFRDRGADRHSKRSAVVQLCHVLEERRQFLKQNLLSKDEGALFHIANQFNLRHQNDNQQGNYDEAFLDWMFWWYLATIDLTDRIATRDSKPQADTDR